MDQIGSELKKIMMAGIGAVSTGVEKSQEVIDKLAKKGEVTFEQAKTISKDSAQKVKKALDDSGISDVFSCKVKKEQVAEDFEFLSVEDLIWLRDELSGVITAKQEAQATQEQTAKEQARQDAQNQDAQNQTPPQE